MSPTFKKSFVLLLLLIIGLIICIPTYYVKDSLSRLEMRKNHPHNPKPPQLSMLATAPDWRKLEIYQKTIRREEFERLLTTIFTTGDAWKSFIEITDTEARIKTGDSASLSVFILHFAQTETSAPRKWRTATELPPAGNEAPLAGIKIALDPGHIGGKWAEMEGRWFVIGDGKPVQEGDMTLQVAKLLKPRLEALGATVTLVRETLEPVTKLRPESLLPIAKKSATTGSPEKLAELLFYRTAEIRARADLVNQVIKPDLVLCLHFDADDWGDPSNPTLTDRTHLHILLNGAYTDEEVGLADQRFALLNKLLQRTHQEEALVGATVADSFAEISGLPPHTYPLESKSARPVAGHPYLWARNLLANRLYDCPVIFMEPYIMNSSIDYARIQAGDYEGLQEINGKKQASIFREYADALTEGLKKHYSHSRKIENSSPSPAPK